MSAAAAGSASAPKLSIEGLGVTYITRSLAGLSVLPQPGVPKQALRSGSPGHLSPGLPQIRA